MMSNKNLVYLLGIFLALPLLALPIVASVNVEKRYEALQKKMEHRIEDVQAKLKIIKQKISKMKGHTKADLNLKYEDFLVMQSTLKEKLKQAKNVSAQRWGHVKDEIEDMADRLETKVDEAIE